MALPYESYNIASSTISWYDITDKPSSQIDWTVDQDDININPENYINTTYTVANNGTLGLTNYNFSEARKNKLNGIATGAQVNVKSNWNEDDQSSDSFIVGKPSIPTELNHLSDVSISNLADLQQLRYNLPNERWENVTVLQPTLDDLTNTNISINVANNDQLKYNSSTYKWENFTALQPNLEDLSNVHINNIQNLQMLAYSNGNWVNFTLGEQSISILSDTSINTLAANDILQYTNGKWRNTPPMLSILSDIDISNKTTNDILQYTNGKWRNTQPTTPPTQVQSNYTETDTNSTAFILNKPFVMSDLVDDELIKREDASNCTGADIRSTVAYDTSASTHNIETYSYLPIGSTAIKIPLSKIISERMLTGTGSDVDNKISFYPSNTEGSSALTIVKPNGSTSIKVGINTADPSEALDIQDGNITFSNSGHDLVQLVPSVEGTNGGKLEIKLKQDGGSLNTHLTMKESGQIGIGCDPSTATLDINGTLRVNSKVLGSGVALGLMSNTTTTDSATYVNLGTQNTTIAGNDIIFKANSTNGTLGDEALKITSGGLVGIGGEPTEKLHVHGNIRLTGLVRGASGTVCKIHYVTWSDSESADVTSTNFNAVVTKTFTKTANTICHVETSFEYSINGWGNDSFEASLDLGHNPAGNTASGHRVTLSYAGNGGGGHRSNGLTECFVMSGGSHAVLSGTTTIYLNMRRINADDNITVRQGFFKVTELWA